MLSLARYHAVNPHLLLTRLFLQIYSCSLVYPPFSAITRASAGLVAYIALRSPDLLSSINLTTARSAHTGIIIPRQCLDIGSSAPSIPVTNCARTGTQTRTIA